MFQLRAFLMTCLLSCTFLSLRVSADASTPEDLFQKGLAAYQNKQYAEAHDAFQKLLDQGRRTPSVFDNLALTALQMDQKPLALAFWRKALSVDPGNRAARAGRDFLESKMQMRPLERDSFNLWAHRELESLSFFELLWLNAVILAIAGFFCLRYWGERTAALEEERPLPAFPTLPSVMGLLLLGSLALVAMKAREEFAPRATITAIKATVRSLPSDEGVDLFAVSGGAEVLVRQSQGGWTQVQNGDGSSGWVKTADLFVTSER